MGTLRIVAPTSEAPSASAWMAAATASEMLSASAGITAVVARVVAVVGTSVVIGAKLGPVNVVLSAVHGNGVDAVLSAALGTGLGDSTNPRTIGNVGTVHSTGVGAALRTGGDIGAALRAGVGVVRCSWDQLRHRTGNRWGRRHCPHCCPWNRRGQRLRPLKQCKPPHCGPPHRGRRPGNQHGPWR